MICVCSSSISMAAQSPRRVYVLMQTQRTSITTLSLLTSPLFPRQNKKSSKQPLFRERIGLADPRNRNAVVPTGYATAIRNRTSYTAAHTSLNLVRVKVSINNSSVGDRAKLFAHLVQHTSFCFQIMLELTKSQETFPASPINWKMVKESLEETAWHHPSDAGRESESKDSS